MTTISPNPASRIAAARGVTTLDSVAPDAVVLVRTVHGDDPLARRLIAAGLWEGVRVERIGRAPFGDPLLFRLHGYRLALRRVEAARVEVVEEQRR